jgi:RHS repeat-associated protein
VNGDGVPDLIWQNLSTNQVTVNYYGGANGSVYQGFNWMNSAGEPSGRNVVGAADFDGNGTPDLVWQYAPTAQVTVNYYSYSQAGGPTNTGWAWLNNAGNPGWTVVGAADMNQDGVPDLIWIDQSDSQHAIGAVTVNYYGGSGGATYEGWAWLNQAGISGWSVGAVADMNSNGEPDLIWQDASPPNTVTAYYYSLAGVCDYTYDDLARLSAASCGSVWAQTFSYDAFGNIGKSGSQSFMPTYSAATNQMTSIGSFTPSYDSNGNLRGDGPYNTYSWDGEGNLAALNGNAETYDALNRRVEQYNGTAYTEIVYGPAGNKLALMNGQTATKVFAPLSGGATAVYNSSGLQYYRHPDWLGSSRVASTPGRTVYYDGAYAPFGENYAETGTTDRNFTGQNQDLTPGSSGILYDFLYREQHSTEGRWISPDPAGIGAADPTNPQSWNRYAYVLGNPLANTDPLGLCSASDNPPCCSTTGTGQMPAYTLSFSSCAQFVMFFNLTNFPGSGNPCAALSGFLGGASPTFLVNQQSTGGASAAPNDATPWYKNACIQNALLKGATSTAIDAIGLIPEGGIASRAIGHAFNYRGIVADQFGNKTIGAIQMGAVIISTGSTGADAQSSNGAISLSGLQTGVGILGIAKSLGAAIPVAGQVIAGVSVGLDLVSTGMEIANCH